MKVQNFSSQLPGAERNAPTVLLLFFALQLSRVNSAACTGSHQPEVTPTPFCNLKPT